MVQFQIPLSSSERNPGEDSWSRRSVLQLHIRVKKKYWCLGRLAEKAVGRSLGDFGEPEDIAEAAAFLASAKARWVGVILSKSTLFLSFCFLFFPVLLSLCLFVSLSFLSFSLFVCLSFFCLFVFLYFCLYGFLSFCPFLFCLSAFSSEHHSDQMSEGFQVSKVTHSVEILKWHWITDSGQLIKLNSIQCFRYMNGATVDVNGGLLWVNIVRFVGQIHVWNVMKALLT